MAPFQVFGQGGIPPPLRAGAPRTRFSCPTLSSGVEATASASVDDESHALLPGSESCRELPSMCWGGGLCPLVLHVPDGPGSMASGGGCSSRHVFE